MDAFFFSFFEESPLKDATKFANIDLNIQKFKMLQ